VAEVSEVKLPEVMAVDEIAMLAVTVPLIAGSEPIVTEFPTVTDAILIACVAGKFPTVTEEILMGTVPLMDAVTLPICAVPAPIVTVPAPIVTTPMRFVPAGSIVPSIALIIFAVNSSSPETDLKFTVFPTVTVPEMAGRELIVRLFPTVTVPPIVTALARSWVLVSPEEVALRMSVMACVPRLTTV
jgi:hypothetical protein